MQSRLLLLAPALLWSTAGAAMKLCQLSGWQIAGGRPLVAGLLSYLGVLQLGLSYLLFARS